MSSIRKGIVSSTADVLQFISSVDIQDRLFHRYAPLLDRRGLPIPPSARANELLDRMRHFISVNPKEHEQIQAILNTVGVINKLPDCTTIIFDFFKSHAGLNRFFNDFRMVLKRSKRKSELSEVTNLAAFVAMCCKEEGAVSADAKILWEELCTHAFKVSQKDAATVLITEATKFGAERVAGMQEFQDAFDFEIGQNYIQKDYWSKVVPHPTSHGFTRYSICTSPLRQQTMKNKGKNRQEPGLNDNMTGFEIRYFYHFNKLVITMPPAGEPRRIAEIFAEKVLGARIDSRRKRFFEHKPPDFQSSSWWDRYRLPPYCGKGALCFVSQLKFIPCEETGQGGDEPFRLVADDSKKEAFLPCTFEGDDKTDIYDQIEAAFKDKFPAELREVVKVRIVLRLHPHCYDDSERDMGAMAETVDIPLTIKPDSCKPYIPARFAKDKVLIETVGRVVHDWDLDGMTVEQHKMYKRK